MTKHLYHHELPEEEKHTPKAHTVPSHSDIASTGAGVDDAVLKKHWDYDTIEKIYNERNKLKMFGMQWKEVHLEGTTWFCEVFIPEIHRWVFGCGYASIYISDNLVNFKLVKTIPGVDQVKSLLVTRWTEADGTRHVRIIAGAGLKIDTEETEPSQIWTSDDYGITWTLRATFSDMVASTKAITELLELNDGTILAFTRGSSYKVFRSTDHGKNWQPFTKLLGVLQILVVDYDFEHNVVGMGTSSGANRGFHYSTDGCATINEGYITDGGDGRIDRIVVHAVCYDPVNKKWFFGTSGDDAHSYLFRADYTDLTTWTEVKQFGGLPAEEDQASILKIRYVEPWGRMFIFTCCAEAVAGVSDYTEVWSTTDGGCAVAGDMKIYREWDSYTCRRLKTLYGDSGKRKSTREIVSTMFADGMLLFGAAGAVEDPERIFVKTHHNKPILSFYPYDVWPNPVASPAVGYVGNFPVRYFDDTADESIKFSFPLFHFDLSKPIRIRLKYCMADAKGAEPATANIRVELSWEVVHRDEDLTPNAATGSSAKTIQVSDVKEIKEEYDEFNIPADSSFFPSDDCGLKITRDADHAEDLRNGDWYLIAVYLFQDV